MARAFSARHYFWKFYQNRGRRWFSRPNCSQFISSPAMPQTDLDLLDLFDMFSYPFLRLSSRKEELVVGQVVRERELFIFLYCTQIWRGHCSSPSQPVFQVLFTADEVGNTFSTAEGKITEKEFHAEIMYKYNMNIVSASQRKQEQEGQKTQFKIRKNSPKLQQKPASS